MKKLLNFIAIVSLPFYTQASDNKMCPDPQKHLNTCLLMRANDKVYTSIQSLLNSGADINTINAKQTTSVLMKASPENALLLLDHPDIDPSLKPKNSKFSPLGQRLFDALEDCNEERFLSRPEKCETHIAAFIKTAEMLDKQSKGCIACQKINHAHQQVKRELDKFHSEYPCLIAVGTLEASDASTLNKIINRATEKFDCNKAAKDKEQKFLSRFKHFLQIDMNGDPL